jgi:hypothetical protein
MLLEAQLVPNPTLLRKRAFELLRACCRRQLDVEASHSYNCRCTRSRAGQASPNSSGAPAWSTAGTRAPMRHKNSADTEQDLNSASPRPWEHPSRAEEEGQFPRFHAAKSTNNAYTSAAASASVDLSFAKNRSHGKPCSIRALGKEMNQVKTRVKIAADNHVTQRYVPPHPASPVLEDRPLSIWERGS